MGFRLGEEPIWCTNLPLYLYQKVRACWEVRLAEIELYTDHKGVSGYHLPNSLRAECKDVGLVWQECTKMSLRDSVLWYTVMGWPGQMLRSYVLFSKICQRLY